MNAYLLRQPVTNAMRGLLVLETGEIFHTLERPWLDNQRNVSCIPSGEYTADYMERSASGKYRKVYHVKDVPNRSGILIHNGNLVSHTKGCLLIGTKPGVLSGKQAVLGSRAALRKFRAAVGDGSFKLHIVGDFNA